MTIQLKICIKQYSTIYEDIIKSTGMVQIQRILEKDILRLPQAKSYDIQAEIWKRDTKNEDSGYRA